VGKPLGKLQRFMAPVPASAWAGCGGTGDWVGISGLDGAGLAASLPRALALRGVAVLPHEKVVAACGNPRFHLLCTIS